MGSKVCNILMLYFIIIDRFKKLTRVICLCSSCDFFFAECYLRHHCLNIHLEKSKIRNLIPTKMKKMRKCTKGTLQDNFQHRLMNLQAGRVKQI